MTGLRTLGTNVNAVVGGIHVYPGSNGVVGNGTGDDTAAIQTLLNKVSPALGLVDVIIHDGTYMIDAVNETVSTHNQRYLGGGLLPPAGTRLRMTPGAILKVIPNDSPAYAAISLDTGQDSVTITGGTILGDRATHDYTTDTSSPTHEWGVGIHVRAVTRLVVDGVTITGCTGDSIRMSAVGTDATLVGYDPADRAVVRNCKLDGARRNNISLVGCDGITIENNVISNAGTNDGVHDGTAPRAGIDLEYASSQAVAHTTIRGNTFSGNVTAAVNIFNGVDTVVEGNFADSPILWGNNAHRALVKNNVLYSATPVTVSVAAIGGSSTGTTDIAVEGNYVSGFSTGIRAPLDSGTVKNNYVTRFVDYGITCYQSVGMDCSGNNVVGDLTATAQVGIRISGCTDPKVKNNHVVGCYTGIQIGTLAGVGLYVLSGNTFIDCFDSIRFAIAATGFVVRNEFRPGGHGSGVGNDVVWSSAASVHAAHNDHHGCGVAYNGSNTGTGFSRVLRNTLSNVVTATAMTFTGTSGKHRIVGNTIIGGLASGSGGAAITITGGVGSYVLKNTVWTAVGATAFTALVTSSASGTTTIRGNDFDGATIANSAGTDTVDNNLQLGVAAPSTGGTTILAAYKAANTTRNNTATRTADPDLTVAVLANSVYAVEAWLGYEATTTADVSTSWSVPTSATLVWATGSLASNATTSTSAPTHSRINSGTSGIYGGIGAAAGAEASPKGLLTTGANSGSVTLNWAQQTAEVSDAILYAGSWLKLTKIA